MATALVEPQARPSGSAPQFSMERYGLGSELVGAAICAHANPPASSNAARQTPIAVRLCGMTLVPKNTALLRAPFVERTITRMPKRRKRQPCLNEALVKIVVRFPPYNDRKADMPGGPVRWPLADIATPIQSPHRLGRAAWVAG